jgi:non-homologous end joining protein Ku
MSTIHRTAPAPTRSTSTVTLHAGLMAIPVSLYTSTETTAVVRREFLDGNPDISVGRISVRRDNNEPVDVANVTRMAQADNGTWVVLTDDEILGCVGVDGTCEVVTFVPADTAGSYLVDGLYQARPKADKRTGPAAAAAFSLLLAGMNERKVHALVRFGMRGVPRYGMLTADGDLFTITPADGVRESLPMPANVASQAELDLVVSLIEAIGVDTPTITDTVAVKVRDYVNVKAASDGVAPTASTPAPAASPSDLMGVLAASIAAAQKAKPAAAKRKTKAAA